jgi:uncharacterized protein (DUF4415 family)
MTSIQRLTGSEAAVRGGSASARASKTRSRSSGPAARSGRSRTVKEASTPKSRNSFSLNGMKLAEFYRPLKKPVTLRLDADVLAWFKKDGRRYQTRINQALRKVMEREMKQHTS